MTDTSHDGVAIVRPGQTYTGKQGFTYGAGISRETVGAQHICMNLLPIPDGVMAKAHYHDGIETIAYVIEGEIVVHYGDELEKQVIVKAGEHCLVGAGVPHAPRNASGAMSRALIAHSSGSDQDGIVMLPELDAKLAARLEAETT
ncbi:MAG: cupin domain-containing protein [Silicimonas sp.]|jgi:uncharacterized RmlC-like cupin family protein|nr:cupin domain-containing protein [Silicimonas sp.]